MLRRPIVVPVSKFGCIFQMEASVGFKIYQGVPLGALNPKRRGEALASIVRGHLSEQYPWKSFCNAEPGTRDDGRRHGVNQAPYDWLCDGRRVECKSSQLRWSLDSKEWYVRFEQVKLVKQDQCFQPVFDELVLAVYSPAHIHIYQHDLAFQVWRRGKATASTGYAIEIRGGKGNCWSEALSTILGKLDASTNGCRRIAELPLGDERVRRAQVEYACPIAQTAYEGVPFAEHSTADRARRLHAIVRKVDSIVNPSAKFDQPFPGHCVNGARRNKFNATCDWIRDGVRVECKTAMLTWDKTRICWRIHFTGIKLGRDVYDELLCAIYSPRGLHIFLHDDYFALSTSGRTTELVGHVLALWGPQNEHNWSAALDAILQRVGASGCQLLAVVPWR